METPASAIIARSLAPSPMAMTRAVASPSSSRTERSFAAFASASTMPRTGDRGQLRRLRLRVDDAPDHPSGEAAIFDIEHVGDAVVEPKPGFQALGEKTEATGYQQRFDAGALHRGEHGLGAGGEPQAFVVDARQRSLVQTLQQADPHPQALGVIDLARHRGGGDRRNFGPDPRHVGDFVYAFDGDQDRKSTRLNSSHANISYAV